MENSQTAFERQGNPWVSEAERLEMQATLLPERGGRRMAKPKPRFIERPRPYPVNEERAMMQWIVAQRGGSRVVRPAQTPKKVGNFQVSCQRELTPTPVVVQPEPFQHLAPAKKVKAPTDAEKQARLQREHVKALADALEHAQARLQRLEAEAKRS